MNMITNAKKFLKVISFLLISCLIIANSMQFASAQEQYVEYKYLDNGDIIKITTIIEEQPLSISLFNKSKTLTVSKEFQYGNKDNIICGYMKLTGTFKYDGSTASATKVSMVASGRNNWSCISKKSSKSGASVYGYAAFKKGSSLTSIEGKITCTKNGTIK